MSANDILNAPIDQSNTRQLWWHWGKDGDGNFITTSPMASHDDMCLFRDMLDYLKRNPDIEKIVIELDQYDDDEPILMMKIHRPDHSVGLGQPEIYCMDV